MEAILIQDEKYLVIYKLERSLFVVNLGILTVCILYCPKRIAKRALYPRYCWPKRNITQYAIY